MVDHVSKEKRSKIMRAVKNKDTTPEMALRKLAFSMGFRYRLHRKDLPGKPDLVFPKYHIVIFVHGCFWHRHKACKKASTPKTNIDMWQAKFNRNTERDASNTAALNKLGWKVEIIWGCETKPPEVLKQRLRSLLI